MRSGCQSIADADHETDWGKYKVFEWPFLAFSDLRKGLKGWRKIQQELGSSPTFASTAVAKKSACCESSSPESHPKCLMSWVDGQDTGTSWRADNIGQSVYGNISCINWCRAWYILYIYISTYTYMYIYIYKYNQIYMCVLYLNFIWFKQPTPSTS